MARQGDILGVTGADTVIGTGVVALGSLKSEGDVTVDGMLTGDITAQGDVTLGVNAVVKGDVSGQNVIVAGALDGDVTAAGEAMIRETGRVTGDISAISLAIQSGGLFMGRSRMQLPPKLRPLSDDDKL